MNFFQKPKPTADEQNQHPQNPMMQPHQPSAQPQRPVAPAPQEPQPQRPVAPAPQEPQPQRPVAPTPNSEQQPSVSTAAPVAKPVTQADEPPSFMPFNQPVAESTTIEKLDYMNEVTSNEYAVENVGPINDINFSDVYIPFDKKTYIWGERTNAGLKLVKFQDFDEFFAQLESAYKDSRSYLLNYKGRNYRVERTVALDGPQYIARKMPVTVPNIRNLGLPSGVYNHLISLADGCGLIILAGATGSGKSTTIAALLKEYLQQKGGYAYTIEDPIEMPLDGIYKTPAGELGLCKQTTPPDGIWEEGIKSALRSKPRYVYLGEIRSPDVASEALRAATSGHLVLSTIHANNVPDAVNALVKYASASGISEEMAFELVANGFLGCVHQVLEGAPKRARVNYLFANPNINESCQVRGMIRSGKLNLATLLEQQRIKIEKKIPLF